MLKQDSDPIPDIPSLNANASQILNVLDGLNNIATMIDDATARSVALIRAETAAAINAIRAEASKKPLLSDKDRGYSSDHGEEY